jgi:hypothetical protein
MVVKDAAWDDVDWVELAKNRDTLRALVNTNEPRCSINFRECIDCLFKKRYSGELVVIFTSVLRPRK